MDVTLLKVTAVFYLLGTGSFIVYLVLLRDFFSRLSPLILLSGFLVHTSALGVHFFYTGYPAVTQFREALSFYSWLMVGVYLLVQFKYRLTILGCFIAPLAFLMSLAAFTFGAGAEELPPGLKTYWLPLHVTFAFLGNAVFALAFGVSLMYLLQEYQLKNKKLTVLYRRFPSLETLDRLNYVFLVWGFPLMTLGIITGSLWAGIHWGNYWSWEPRQISSGITWLLYGALLHGRVTAGLRGKKAALLTIVGFAVVLGYFLWGDFVFPSRHGGRFE
ncbi:MAG: cytochrome c biogenesis protein CcsA [Deltaproteobacteria bacterium]|jgi:cytochrome c-type biogenesis protein CcsB|nr:cytochrome c biogenesis protein CcsA [Deltaproteobacteria bacterium]